MGPRRRGSNAIGVVRSTDGSRTGPGCRKVRRRRGSLVPGGGARRLLPGGALLVLFPLVVPATAGGQPACADLTVAGWRPAPPRSADSLALALPARIRLDPDAAPPPVSGHLDAALEPRPDPDWSAPARVGTAEGALDGPHEHRSWQEGPDGALELRFVSGGSGVVVRFPPPSPGADRDAPRSGRATAHWDLPRGTHAAAARLDPVRCDAPLEAAARFRWSFPVRIPRDGAPDAALGRPLPPGSAREREDGTLVLAGEPGGFLREARTVRVEPGEDGRLRRVVVELGDDVPHARVLARLEEAWGPATVYYGTTVRWLGRALRYTLLAPACGGWIVEMEVRPGVVPPPA